MGGHLFTTRLVVDRDKPMNLKCRPRVTKWSKYFDSDSFFNNVLTLTL